MYSAFKLVRGNASQRLNTTASSRKILNATNPLFGDPVAYPLVVFLSTVTGAIVGLCGVFMGNTLTTRAQRRHWTRDKQIETCTSIITESTYTQLALLAAWKQGGRLDWTAWNQVLAVVWLVNEPDVIQAAARMDRIFWLSSTQINSGQLQSDEDWIRLRDQMEQARLTFINIARTRIVGFKQSVDQVLVSRPPLSEETTHDEESGGTQV